MSTAAAAPGVNGGGGQWAGFLAATCPYGKTDVQEWGGGGGEVSGGVLWGEGGQPLRTEPFTP